tara:strand:+ start:7564 stop:8415 length:852 start_codon:yes stop_codon:yes gene_type:complete
MKKHHLLFILLITTYLSSFSQIRLNHNIGDKLIKKRISSCSYGGVNWGRTFILADFGISNLEDFIITNAQIGIYEAGWGSKIIFYIYEIDEYFPHSLSKDNLIGQSQSVDVPSSIKLDIVSLNFNEPVIVPAGVKKILVEVHQEGSRSSAVTFPAGTEEGHDYSWFSTTNGGCLNKVYKKAKDLGWIKANFYINASGYKTLSTKKYNSINSISLTPNLAEDFISIKSQNKIHRVEFYSMTGTLVMIKNSNSLQKIYISELKSGIYVLKIFTINNITLRRMIKS